MLYLRNEMIALFLVEITPIFFKNFLSDELKKSDCKK